MKKEKQIQGNKYEYRNLEVVLFLRVLSISFCNLNGFLINMLFCIMIIILPAHIREKYKLNFQLNNFEKKSGCNYSSDAKLIIRYEMFSS